MHLLLESHLIFREACKLIEVGFEYVCDMDGVRLLRKRK